MADSIEKENSKGLSRQFVTFTLAEETFGVDTDRIQEIIGYRSFTKIPEQPRYMPGVLNLRGSVVPVVDLRLKFNLEPRPYDRYTVILIIKISERTVGLVVDAVSDVISLKPEQMQPPPQVSKKPHYAFIQAVARMDDQFIIILDVEKVLSEDEREHLKGFE